MLLLSEISDKVREISMLKLSNGGLWTRSGLFFIFWTTAV